MAGASDVTLLIQAALIQAALGERYQYIAEDFALSSQLLSLGAPRPEFDRLFGGITDIPREDIVRAMTTRPETMDDLFRRVNAEYGSTARVLRAIGAPAQLLATVRELLPIPSKAHA